MDASVPSAGLVWFILNPYEIMIRLNSPRPKTQLRGWFSPTSVGEPWPFRVARRMSRVPRSLCYLTEGLTEMHSPMQLGGKAGKVLQVGTPEQWGRKAAGGEAASEWRLQEKSGAVASLTVTAEKLAGENACLLIVPSAVGGLAGIGQARRSNLETTL